jgi:hypothetical protein
MKNGATRRVRIGHVVCRTSGCAAASPVAPSFERTRTRNSLPPFSSSTDAIGTGSRQSSLRSTGFAPASAIFCCWAPTAVGPPYTRRTLRAAPAVRAPAWMNRRRFVGVVTRLLGLIDAQTIPPRDAPVDNVAISGIVLQGVDAAGVPASGAAPAELEQSVLAEPAIRIFRQGSEAVYAYEVYDGAPGDKSPLMATATLMREGAIVHQGAPVAIASKGGGGSVRVTPAVGRLSLNQVPPGFYTLRIAVTRVRDGRPVPQATQWASFEVRR